MFSWFPLHSKIEIKMYLNFKKILICFITWIVIKVSSRVKVSSFFCEQHVISSTLHVYRMSLLIAHRVHIIGVQWGGRVLNEGDDKVKGIRALVFSVPKLLCSPWKFCLWGDVENSYKNIHYEFQYIKINSTRGGNGNAVKLTWILYICWGVYIIMYNYG